MGEKLSELCNRFLSPLETRLSHITSVSNPFTLLDLKVSISIAGVSKSPNPPRHSRCAILSMSETRNTQDRVYWIQYVGSVRAGYVEDA